MPSSLGGNTLRVSASDAQLLANAGPVASMLSTYSSATLQQRPRPMRGRNPISGDPAREVTPSKSNSQVMTLHDGRPFMFPPRGTLKSIGSTGGFNQSIMNSSSQLDAHGSSPASRSKAEKLQYHIWCEAQARKAAERELRVITIHGRSRPPWVGQGRASGYGELNYRERLMPQTR